MLAAVLLAGCSRAPITGRRQLILVPDSQLNSMALDAYQQFLSEHELSTNREEAEMVKSVGRRIQRAVEQYAAGSELDLEGYQWEFNLVQDDAINAWAMPGGKVVVYTGLMPVARDEAGLATVMGHEIAHAIARHGNERMSQGLMVEMGGLALSRALAEKGAATRELFMKSYGLGTQVGVILPYSRKHEYEADHLGLIFMAMAGYEPGAAVSFWERMAAAKQGGAPPEFLSTHPADENRIARLQELLPEARQYYQPAP